MLHQTLRAKLSRPTIFYQAKKLPPYQASHISVTTGPSKCSTVAKITGHPSCVGKYKACEENGWALDCGSAARNGSLKRVHMDCKKPGTQDDCNNGSKSRKSDEVCRRIEAQREGQAGNRLPLRLNTMRLACVWWAGRVGNDDISSTLYRD